MSELVIFLIGQAIVIVSGLLSIYVKVSLKLKELDIRVHMLEKQDDAIVGKLDEILTHINKISIDLINKQDRL